MTDCTRGCLLTGQHIPDCTCTNECPDHHDHCEGCLPKPAVVGRYCQRCADKFRDALTAIPDLAATTAHMPGGRLVTKAGDIHTADRKPTKVDQLSLSPAWDEADDAITWAYKWALLVADLNGDAGPFTYTTAGLPAVNLATITTHITYLANRLTQLLTDDYHDEIYTDTLNLRRRLQHATGTDRLEHRIKERCPSCNQRTLTREDGASKVVCRNNDCNRVWHEHEYQRLAHVAAS